ncbi:PAS domain-containing protein [Kutzneria albida]|uniref:ANTAR domain-containing protein n=1 Tax=Kutzneria albida DSM 43870 TaxID=1449976 RepID=W5WB73_9PSEU|nr:PAS domain-containing protein [Kutzneria albida]AHH98020.1 hypothetical protein KALB_4658 [Kutzneria albida DSM 43870]
MHESLRSVADSALFEATAAPYLVLDAGLRIRAVNSAYLRATRRTREELLDLLLFEVFPADPCAEGVRNLRASLERVLRYGRPDAMGVQPYDIPPPGGTGEFVCRTWSLVNSPLLDEAGRVVGVLHHAEDVTALAESARRNEIIATCYRGAYQALAADDPLAGWFGLAEAVCSAAVQRLNSVDAAALSLRTPDGVEELLAATDEWAQRLEELHYALGEGPGVSAFLDGRPALAPDLSDAPRWPVFADAALAMGAVAVFAFPLQANGAPLGTVRLYSRGPGLLDGQQSADAAVLAQVATASLLDEGAAHRLSERPGHYQDVNLAAGMLAAQGGVGVAEALSRLRAHAFGQDRRLLAVAAEVVAGRLRFADLSD